MGARTYLQRKWENDVKNTCLFVLIACLHKRVRKRLARSSVLRGDLLRHCERNAVKRGKPESFHFAENLLPYSRSWVATSRVALLAMTNTSAHSELVEGSHQSVRGDPVSSTGVNAALTLTSVRGDPVSSTGVNAALTLTSVRGELVEP
jgi:hypothetical protein